MKIGKSEEEIKRIEAQFGKLKQGVDDVLPASLELAIAAARGKFDLRKVKASQIVKLFSCCISSGVTVLESAHVISAEDAKKAAGILTSVESKAADVAANVDAARDASDFEKVNPMRSELPVVAESIIEKAVEKAVADAVAEVVAPVVLPEVVAPSSSEGDAKTESKSEETQAKTE